MSNWFPRYDPSSGALISEGDGRYQCQWYAPGVPIWHQDGVIWINAAPTSAPALNTITAGGARWAGTHGGPDVICSWQVTVFGAGNPALDPDGVLAYKDDYHSNDAGLVLTGVGEVDRGPISDVRMARQLLAYTKGSSHSYGYDRAQRLVVDLAVPGLSTFRPIPIDTPTGPWVLNHTDTGVLLRPVSDPLYGYTFDNGGNTFYPDGYYDAGADTIRVAFTNDAGILQELLFSLAVPLSDLLPDEGGGNGEEEGGGEGGAAEGGEEGGAEGGGETDGEEGGAGGDGNGDTGGGGDDVKALLPDDQFQAMCGDVGREAARFLQRRPEEIEQGARQLGDKARGQETPRNPLAFELCNGAGLRSGTPPDMPDEQVTELWQAMEALNAKYGL